MPILFNFHILLATFYTIFGTNILIQCLVPVPVCSMFSCFAENPYETESKRDKTDGDYFWNICEIWEENQRETVPEGAMRHGGAPLTLVGPP